MADRDSKYSGYASPPCYAHELDELYRDLAVPDSDTRRDVMRWRKAERERLRTLRGALDAGQRERELATICARLDDLLQSCAVTVLGAYWPMHGEPDLRAWLRRRADSGLVIALPVIHASRQPLRYSRWRTGAAMRRGFWGIAEPAADDWVEPQMVLAPALGIDRQQHRLGYGGGYFDRSLAAAEPPRQAVGIGYSCARIASIYPQPHDMAMDFVIIGEAGENPPQD